MITSHDLIGRLVQNITCTDQDVWHTQFLMEALNVHKSACLLLTKCVCFYSVGLINRFCHPSQKKKSIYNFSQFTHRHVLLNLYLLQKIKAKMFILLFSI